MSSYQSSVNRQVTANRICSNCSKLWTVSKTIYANTIQNSRKDAAEKVQFVLGSKVSDFSSSHKIICPDCGHFAVEAIRAHFPDGFLRGLLKFYNDSKGENLAFFILGTVILALPMSIYLFNKSFNDISIIAWLGALFCFGYPLSFLVTFLKSRSFLPLVTQKLESMTEEELNILALDCYKENKSSFKIEPRRSCFISTLISLAKSGQTITVSQTCSNCGKQWAANSMNPKGKGLLCPDCGHFAIETVKAICPNGYSDGIMKKYDITIWKSFRKLIYSSIAFVSVQFLKQNYTLAMGFPPIKWTLLIVIYATAIASIYYLGLFILGVFFKSSTSRKLEYLSDERLIAIALSCYKESGYLFYGGQWILKTIFLRESDQITIDKPVKTNTIFRTCSNCGKQWAKDVTLLKGEGQLCLDCDHFTIEAIKDNFPAGYLDGLIKKYDKATWENFSSFLYYTVLLLIPLIIYIKNYSTLISNSAFNWLLSFAIILLGYFALKYLKIFISGLMNKSSVIHKLESMTEEELITFSANCYKENKNSFYNLNWMRSLMLLKAPDRSGQTVAPKFFNDDDSLKLDSDHFTIEAARNNLLNCLRSLMLLKVRDKPGQTVAVKETEKSDVGQVQ